MQAAQNLYLQQNSDVSDVILSDKVINDFHISAKTAIGRSKVSTPLQIILDNGLFKQGSVLNYGKGRTTLDSQAIRDKGLFVCDYDYVWCPDPDVLGTNYDYVYCGYVVNTLPPEARTHIYTQLDNVCKGIVFIAARSDKIKGTPESDGVRTSKGTFQKSYSKGALKNEAQSHFKYVEEIKGKSGMSIVMCSNTVDFNHV